MLALDLAPRAQPVDPRADFTEADRLRQFGKELDAIRDRTLAKVGESDLAYVKRLNWFSRSMEAVGRVLIHFSLEPVSFAIGIFALWLHKQLQSMEVGHTALHGAYDKLEGAEAFYSKTFSWDTAIDEESWRQGHNIKHHGNTNVAGKDPDIHFGPVRLTERTPHRLQHYAQLLVTLGLVCPNFGPLMNLHVSGVLDLVYDNGQEGKLDFLPDRSWRSARTALKRAFRKFGPFYLKNFVFFPLLAGPFFWKVLLGNWLADVVCGVYSAATIYCGHAGTQTASYPAGTKAQSRGEWYAMQVESTNNFEVSLPISILCGGLDLQIEHHLFPTLPPQRLREIAAEVRAVCARHGVSYRSQSWGRTLKDVLRHLARLSRNGGSRAVLQEMA